MTWSDPGARQFSARQRPEVPGGLDEAPGGGLHAFPGGLLGAAGRTARRIDARTPTDRDRAIDGLRAIALVAVVIGHWLLGGLTRGEGGALDTASPLASLGQLAPLSWVFQLLGLFFLVGGYASVRSWRRAAGRGVETGAWVRARLVRLGRPVGAVGVAWAVLVPELHTVGVPGDTLRTAVTLVAQPLWFVVVYAALTALTPYCDRAVRRAGAWSAAPLLCCVAAVDVLRYGPYADAVPPAIGLLNVLPGWLFGYQLGVAWGRGRLRRGGAWLLLVGGGVLFVALVTWCGYPASMVGVPGEARTNSHPPSLLVVALAATQCGAAVLLRGPLARLLRRPVLWAPVALINVSALTVLCWHQCAPLALALPAAHLGEVPGLVGAPDSPGWLLLRCAWLPVFGGLLVVLVRWARQFERGPVSRPVSAAQSGSEPGGVSRCARS
ncbi:acyltransferase family protein [Streptomyces zagrosensis]|uniref:Peptidoglycan/LPS O-acetylase OafA/YrhL n=1 Tax=Streptomyces zagrosensis TaxID=1042984 RepID=A0A7W9UVX2_9ACTN|nr:acyltransferase [Streptomyces zagrosensis]MBB5933168.1 peptidoglycan/LPS O-acetylase OafA/YrhL [Streptomyces zagrosensis]